MTRRISRAVMLFALACLGDDRREWAAAMRAEFAVAVDDGEPLRFAAGCLLAAWREMVTSEEGRFVLTCYAMVLALLIPMAALQIGCALFGLPYLYPGGRGLAGALIEGGAHQHLLRGVYQATIPSLAMLQLLIGVGHLRVAWLLLERDWTGVVRLGASTLAAMLTLILFMTVLFLDSSQALLQGAVLAIELGIVAIAARKHAQFRAHAGGVTSE